MNNPTATPGIAGATPMTPTTTRVPSASISPTLAPVALVTPTIAPSASITPTRAAIASPTVIAPTRQSPAPPLNPNPVIKFDVSPSGRFGVSTLLGDPRRNDDDHKLLTYNQSGESSNTRIFLDGATPIFGGNEGRLSLLTRADGALIGARWELNRIIITQSLSIVPGASTNLYDTVRVEYILENRDTRPHTLGLRMMIDTYIGANDGVPFTVPGQPGIVTRALDLRGKTIPDFIQVLEKPSLTDPGVLINVTLAGADTTPPERLVISGYPGANAEWDYLANVGGVGALLGRDGKVGGDSAIGLFFPVEVLQPNARRSIVTYYGLGAISSVETRNSKLGLSVSTKGVDEGSQFWVVATIGNPRADQRVTLILPPQLEVVEGQITQSVAPEANAEFTTRSWLVRAKSSGSEIKFSVKLDPDNVLEEKTLDIFAHLPTPTPTR
jgi:hypothetical protein